MQQQFHVEGMTCQHCVRAVTRAVQQLDAQAAVQVDLKAATVTVDSTQPRLRIAEAIREEGYPVAP
jgi:copper chaperone